MLELGTADFGHLAGDLLASEHAVRFRAQGRSMAPFVPDGAVVRVEPVEAKAVRLFDVCLCRLGSGGVVLHRVVGRTEQGWLTAGDARDGVFAEVRPEDVLGRAREVRAGLRRYDPSGAPARWLARIWYGLRPLRRRLP